MEIDEACKKTGFLICEFQPDADPCDSCGKTHRQHYFIRTCYEVNEGDYFCAKCVIRRAEESEEIVDAECTQCGDTYQTWVDQEPDLCLDCFTAKHANTN